MSAPGPPQSMDAHQPIHLKSDRGPQMTSSLNASMDSILSTDHHKTLSRKVPTLVACSHLTTDFPTRSSLGQDLCPLYTNGPLVPVSVDCLKPNRCQPLSCHDLVWLLFLDLTSHNIIKGTQCFLGSKHSMHLKFYSPTGELDSN